MHGGGPQAASRTATTAGESGGRVCAEILARRPSGTAARVLTRSQARRGSQTPAWPAHWLASALWVVLCPPRIALAPPAAALCRSQHGETEGSCCTDHAPGVLLALPLCLCETCEAMSLCRARRLQRRLWRQAAMHMWLPRRPAPAVHWTAPA